MRHDHLFVYGTLSQSAGHPLGALMREHADYVGPGAIRARLYVIDDPDEPGENFYPGALPSPYPTDRVFGEVYLIKSPDEVFPVLDNFEACGPNWSEPHEFALRSVEVMMDDGGSIRASSYLYTWDIADAVRIPSGRYEERAPNVR